MSVVLIIAASMIGLFIAATHMIDNSKLLAAQSKTLKSPILLTDNLEFWLETTHSDSIDTNEAIDGRIVNNWYNLNNRVENANNALSTGNIIYTRHGINSLPAIEFNESSGHFNISHSFNPANDDMTIFVVAQCNIIEASDYIIIQQLDGTGTGRAILYCESTNNKIRTNIGAAALDGDVFKIKPEIYTVTLENGTLSIYTNGTLGNSTTVTAESADGDIRIGDGKTAGNATLDGFIGEIIMFDRSLKTKEKEAIEEYLSKKWQIPLN